MYFLLRTIGFKGGYNLNGGIDSNFFNVLYAALVSFFGALCKEINDRSRNKENLGVFIGEVLLHGFSGWVVGMTAVRWFNITDAIGLSICAGIGGLLGFDLVKVLSKILITSVANSRNVKLNEEDTNFDNKK